MERKARSLAWVVAVWSAIAISVAMLIYALVQLRLNTAARPEALALEHATHVIILGAVLYGVLSFALRRVLVAPLKAVSKHLYGVATGHLEPITVRSNIEEVQDLASAVNLMIGRIRLHRDESALQLASEDIAVIRDLAEVAPEHQAELGARLDRLDRALRGVH